MRFLTFLGVLLGALSPVFYFLDSRLSNFYVFNPSDLHLLTLSAIEAHGNDTAAVVKFIVQDLSTKLPQHVNLDEEWIFNNAGGAMGAMYIIHASITEYLIIFGSAVGTEGHSGRHTADDYFHILRGTQLAFTPGTYEPEVYPQGSMHLMKRGEVKQYKMETTCFALEYARGWIPPMLFFGYADTFTSTLDFPTLWRTTWVTGREMMTNLAKGKF
ncbi:C-8 sterol isomerase [Clohesyomyces aquaticus]|uniref:C-8 sterol isomerase n=1 Tax=Clohesyomyces aquaticus TaxID=1231657 RepID=A0A1Y2A3Y3_9PLEO|nr:C-8 sterol isomerase [Clohesyomyces aquaticus]